MAVHQSTVTVPLGTGNASTTGVGFQPVAVMFWGIEAGFGSPSNFFGVATAPGEQWNFWTGEDDEASTYNRRYRMFRDDSCINILNQPLFATARVRASLVSMDADGFTLNFAAVNTVPPINYMAIGGDNISGAKAGKFQLGSSTGTTAITGVGFRPQALIVAQQLSSNEETLDGFSAWGMGFADAQLNQFSTFGLGHTGSPPTAVSHIWRPDAVACAFFSANAYVLELDSMDADGFTVNVADASAGNIVHGYLAIDSAAAAVGHATQPDAPGLATFTGLGFEPAGVLFAWNGVDIPSTTGSQSTPIRPGVGGFTAGTGASISFIHRDDAPFGAYVPTGYEDSPEAVNIRGIGSQVSPDPHLPLGFAQGSSFAQGEFTIDWTVAVAGADRETVWLALPGELPANWLPHIYRRVLG